MGRARRQGCLHHGAARGQGRSHAIRLAEEGAKIIGIDICEDVASIAELYPLATQADLDETVRLVEEVGGEILAAKADVREFTQLEAVVAQGIERFGHVDICLANAGVVALKKSWETPEQTWDDVIAINLKGVWNSVRAVHPGHDRSGHGRGHRHHQLGGRPQGVPEHLGVLGGQERLHRPHAVPGR